MYSKYMYRRIIILLFCISSIQCWSKPGDKKFNHQDIFPLSVASGDPEAHGFTLMTHINRAVMSKNNPLVVLEISDSRDFSKIIYQQMIDLSDVMSLTDTCQPEGFPLNSYNQEMLEISQTFYPDQAQEIPVKISVSDPAIGAGQYSYYRFEYQGVRSRTGRARTLPEPDDQSIEDLKLAVVTCQDYTTGYYHGFEELASEALDFVLHLGDAIYEYGQYAGMRKKDYVRPISLPHGVMSLPPEEGVRKANSLADYRLIYRMERSDPEFQKALENHTWIFTRDDHEFADNVYWDYRNNEPGFPAHDPRKNWPKEAKRQVMINALRAWSEYLPMKTRFNPLAHSPQEALGDFYKSYQFGALADLFLIAGRVFRGPLSGNDQADTMLGPSQKDWLLNKIHYSRSKWQLLGNQTLMAPLRVTGTTKKIVQNFISLTPEGAVNSDSWDGFHDERQEILEALSQKDQVVVFIGDMHTSLASYLKKDFNIMSNQIRDNIIGAEFMTPSVTSPHFSDSIRAKTHLSGFTPVTRSVFKKKNPHLKHFHGSIYGYSLAYINKDRIDWFVYKIGKKNKRFKKLRKYLYYTPANRTIGKLNKSQLKDKNKEQLLRNREA